jgi:hypothetical protein
MNFDPILIIFIIIVVLQFAVILIRNRRSMTSYRLIAGDCECGHYHSCHKNGTGKCAVVVMDVGRRLSHCACQLYIPSRGSAASEVVDKELDRLRKMSGIN